MASSINSIASTLAFSGERTRLHRLPRCYNLAFSVLISACERSLNPIAETPKNFRPNRHSHEFLKVNIAVRMRSAVQNVHHGHGRMFALTPPRYAIQRQLDARWPGACAAPWKPPGWH